MHRGPLRLWRVARHCLASAICVAGPALAGPAPRTTTLSAIQMFEAADRAQSSGDWQAASAIYAALGHDPDIEIRTEARFRRGMMLAGRRQYADAAIEFRAILDEKPDALRVRLELARMLAAMGHETDARRQLRQAEAGHLPAEIAASVNQFSRALQSRKSFGGSLELSVAPDSNINRATQARTLDTIIAPLTLSRDARARSGFGLSTSGQAFARIAITSKLALLPRISESGEIYRATQFDDISGSALIGLEWSAGADRLTPSVGRTWRWYGGKGYARTNTASFNWLHPAGRTTQWTLGASASRANYLRDDLEDGSIYDMNAQIDHALSPRAGISLSGDVTRQTARDPGFATWAGSATILGWREIGKTTAYFSVTARHTVGDERLFLFPEKRGDWLLSLRAGATLRKFRIGSLAPIVRVGYDYNQSTIGIYAYKRLFANIGIVKAF